MPFAISGELLDACVLSLVADRDSYGYELTQRLNQIIEVSESTLYPVLRRLTKDAKLSTYDKPYQGRNRRYYQVTDVGLEQLEEYKDNWKEYKGKLDILLGDKDDE